MISFKSYSDITQPSTCPNSLYSVITQQKLMRHHTAFSHHIQVPLSNSPTQVETQKWNF